MFQSWYRSRAIGMALLIVPWLLYLSYALLSAQDEIVQESALQAPIEKVEFHGKGDYRHFKTTVLLPDGEAFELNLAPSPAPRIGQQLPLLMRSYESGKRDYALDRKNWRTQSHSTSVQTRRKRAE